MNTAPLVARLRERLPHLLAIHLFGSHATGGVHPESDLDLAVLVAGKVDPLFLWDLALELEPLAGCAVDLIDLRAASTVLQHQVITTGRPLWTGDALQSDLFACFVLSDKLDLDLARAPLLAQIAREGRIHGR
ncbi:MAG: nucleotidyltransferase domain-containing protein [Magnetococcales bacterium]|nr:nucleotidyltransferase domain-containing protein [Magnetococcales bacterium]